MMPDSQALICSRQLQTVDMFPHTVEKVDMFLTTTDIHSGVSGHIETVVCLHAPNRKDNP